MFNYFIALQTKCVCSKIHDYSYLQVWVHISNNTFKRVFTPYVYVKCAKVQRLKPLKTQVCL